MKEFSPIPCCRPRSLRVFVAGPRWPPISRRSGNGPTNIRLTKSPAASRSGINRAFRRRCAVMGKRFFTLSQKEMQSLGYARHDLNLTGFGT